MALCSVRFKKVGLFFLLLSSLWLSVSCLSCILCLFCTNRHCTNSQCHVNKVLRVSEFPWSRCKVNSINMYLIPPWSRYSNPSRLLCHCCVLFVFFGSCCRLWLALLTCSLTSLSPRVLLPSQVLYQQFKFFLNLYFLVVACSQFVPSLKIGYLYTYWAPLVNALQFLLCY